MGVINKIVTLEYRHFFEGPKAIILSIVKEFYANVSEARVDRVMVRIEQIAFGKSTINSYYGLRDIEQREHKAFLGKVNFDEVIQTFKWVEHNGKILNGKYKNFDAKYFTNIS